MTVAILLAEVVGLNDVSSPLLVAILCHWLVGFSLAIDTGSMVSRSHPAIVSAPEPKQWRDGYVRLGGITFLSIISCYLGTS